MTQYVAVKFRETDLRTYTYANDLDPVAPGDRVLVTTAKGQQRVTVVEVTDEAPPFACKPIDGMAEQPPADDLDEHGLPIDDSAIPYKPSLDAPRASPLDDDVVTF